MSAPVAALVIDPYRVNVPGVPKAMQQYDAWCHWMLEACKDGKLSKEPFVAGSNRHAATNDPKSLVGFAAAVHHLTPQRGLGYVFLSDKQHVFIDLDDCADPETGKLTIWAQRIVEQVPTYAEYSPSREGVHIYALGEQLPKGSKTSHCELYSAGRFGTITGDRLPGSPADMVATNVDWLFQLNERDAFNFKRYPDLEQLMLGNWDGKYESQSEADLALCSYLSQLLDDPVDIDRAFRLSGLMREKWDSPRGDSTYGAQTIQAVIGRASKSHIYIPSSTSTSTTELIVSKDGSPKACVANAITALRSTSCLALDQFTLKVVLHDAAPWSSSTVTRPWSDVDAVAAAEWMQHRRILVSSNIAHEAALRVADEHKVHPVRSYLDECANTWDRVPRVDRWLTTYLGVADNEYTRAVGKCWLISGVARIFQPGCQADSTLLLEGPQGIKKSSALRSLAVRDEWFLDHIAADLSHKDSRQALCGVWICELSELTSVRRSTVESVKSFLTSRFDRYRPAYGRVTVDIPRQNIFAGSTNDLEPLIDPSGNRRYWPVTCGKQIDVEAIQRDRDLLWGEAVTCYRAGEPWWLPTALNAQAEREQAQRVESDAWDDAIAVWIERPQERFISATSTKASIPWFGSQRGKINLSDLLIHGLGRDPEDLKPSDQNRAARYFVHRKWKRKQQGSGPNRGRWYYVHPDFYPPPSTSPEVQP